MEEVVEVLHPVAERREEDLCSAAVEVEDLERLVIQDQQEEHTVHIHPEAAALLEERRLLEVLVPLEPLEILRMAVAVEAPEVLQTLRQEQADEVETAARLAVAVEVEEVAEVLLEQAVVAVTEELEGSML